MGCLKRFAHWYRNIVAHGYRSSDTVAQRQQKWIALNMSLLSCFFLVAAYGLWGFLRLPDGGAARHLSAGRRDMFVLMVAFGSVASFLLVVGVCWFFAMKSHAVIRGFFLVVGFILASVAHCTFGCDVTMGKADSFLFLAPSIIAYVILGGCHKVAVAWAGFSFAWVIFFYTAAMTNLDHCPVSPREFPTSNHFSLLLLLTSQGMCLVSAYWFVSEIEVQGKVLVDNTQTVQEILSVLARFDLQEMTNLQQQITAQPIKDRSIQGDILLILERLKRLRPFLQDSAFADSEDRADDDARTTMCEHLTAPNPTSDLHLSAVDVDNSHPDGTHKQLLLGSSIPESQRAHAAVRPDSTHVVNCTDDNEFDQASQGGDARSPSTSSGNSIMVPVLPGTPVPLPPKSDRRSADPPPRDPQELRQVTQAAGQDSVAVAGLKGRPATLLVMELDSIDIIASTTGVDLAEPLSAITDMIVSQVKKSKGSVIFFRGQILASWNTVYRSLLHVKAATSCALDVQRELKQMSLQYPMPNVHMAIVSDTLMCGNVGTSLVSYSILGPIVQAAFDLISLNERVGTQVLMPDYTFHP